MTREKSEVGALRNEARHLRAEAVRLEGEATDARERERLWKVAAITASAVGSVVILALVLTGARPSETLDRPVDAAPVVAVSEPVAPAAAAPTPVVAAPPAVVAPVVVAPPTVTAPAIDVDEARARTHVVGSGDTLYKLAGQYYGDSEQWEKIRDANQSLLKGRIDLKLGTKLKIP